ncbi:MAG: rhodanese-like domain-containing protein [Opitutales bacterium]|jgi:rhodanese-related sulfurtransferase|tara:strand:- start:1533 stop:1970 length:438 start_codon:yes stop_codon:yes gene_type:complete
MILKKHFGSLSLTLLGFLFLSCESNEEGNLAEKQTELNIEGIKIENIKATVVAKMLEENPDLFILDIRTPEEFNLGHIPEAINIDYKADNFESELKKLDRNQTYLMHCRSGRRSADSLDIFQKLGFSHIIHIDDGILGWSKELVK